MSYQERYKKACGIANEWQGLLSDAYNYTIPERNGWTRKDEGQEENTPLYDDTAVLSAPRFASRMQRSLMPEWTEWVKFTAGSDIQEEDEATVNSQLEQLTKQFHGEIAKSNFYTEIQPSLIDCSISTGAIMGEPNAYGSEDLITWRSIPLHQLKIEKSFNGELCNMWWPRKVVGQVIKDTWGDDVPQKLNEHIEKDPLETHEIVTGQVKEGNIYKLVVMWEGDAFVETEHEAARMIAFGLTAMPDESYRRGPGLQVLPTIRRVNKVTEYYLNAAAFAVGGMWTGMDDGIFNPHTFNPEVGSVVPVSSNSNQNPSLRRLDAGPNIQLSELIISDMQDSIRKAFFVDPLGDISDPVRTLGEQQLRMQEFMKDQGAAIARLKHELVDKVVQLVVDVMRDLGEFPDIKVDGKAIKISYVSTLSRQDEMDEFQNIRLFLDSVSGLPPEVVGAKIKIEDLPTLLSKSLDLPSSLIRTQEELQKIETQQREMMKQQQGPQIEQ